MNERVMPAVVTYWQFPDEEEAFLTYLERTGDVLALPDHWVKTEQELSPMPIRSFVAAYDPDQFSFGLKQHVDQLQFERTQHEGEWGFMTPGEVQSCLIGYSRPKYRNGNKLGQSNLAAYWTCLVESKSVIIDKDPEFVKWGKRIFAWVRRHTPEWHQYRGYRATRRVKKAIEKGSVEVVH